MRKSKPMDPIQFIQNRLGGHIIDMEEYNGMKQNLIQINKDMIQMKAELTKLKLIVSEFTQAHASIDDAERSLDNSNQSMENNVADNGNHVTMLHDDDDDETLLFDEAADQTVIDVMEQDLQANDLSTKQQKNDEFIMEIVEVDVMQSNQSTKSIDSVENDEIISDHVANAQPLAMLTDFEPKITTQDGNDSIGENVDCQNSSTEMVSVENGNSNDQFDHTMYAVEISHIEDTGSTSTPIDGNTPQKLMAEANIDDADANMVINIEHLPIVMKSDDLEDQPL